MTEMNPLVQHDRCVARGKGVGMARESRGRFVHFVSFLADEMGQSYCFWQFSLPSPQKASAHTVRGAKVRRGDLCAHDGPDPAAKGRSIPPVIYSNSIVTLRSVSIIVMSYVQTCTVLEARRTTWTSS